MRSLLVTVGTHEQPFDRLLREIDALTDQAGTIYGLAAFCQYGYSRYVPKVESRAMLGAEELEERVHTATIIVTHGGPGSIMPGLKAGTRMVLVPRQRRFGEHVDDHQVAFCRRIGSSYDLPVVEDIGELGVAIKTALEAPARETQQDDRVTNSLQTMSQLIAELVARR